MRTQVLKKKNGVRKSPGLSVKHLLAALELGSADDTVLRYLDFLTAVAWILLVSPLRGGDIAATIAPHVGHISGIDPSPWQRCPALQSRHAHCRRPPGNAGRTPLRY